MRTADFHYVLPPDLIAQHPAPRRDQSRLMTLDRVSGSIAHTSFGEFPASLRPGDVLVLNDSKVIRARLRGRKDRAGADLEVLLVEENFTNDWWAMVRPGKRAGIGTQIWFADRERPIETVHAVVTEISPEGHRRLSFTGAADVREELDGLGDVPLPPYIKRPEGAAEAEDIARYQTVYARERGSVAAPTAGLHFTSELLERVRRCGVEPRFITLHVGPGTFAPVKSADLSAHPIHQERFMIPPETADAVNRAREEGRRIVAVGTTTLRALESAASAQGRIAAAGPARTRLFIHPPHTFRIVDALLTNFHLPCSTLLMLVCAFAAPGETRGRELILGAYAEAMRRRYSFFSYGDAMLLR